jgi:uncharacterized repeat protein (TIGR03803 family)
MEIARFSPQIGHADRMITKPKLIACLALVLSGGLSASARAVTDTAARAPGGVEMTTLVSFDGTNGTWPQAGLVLGTDGNFYGTTEYGGASIGQGNSGLGYGTVFRVTTNGLLTSLVSFNVTNGANPPAGLVQGNDGNLYGLTYAGGTNGSGGVAFCMSPAGILKVLHSFGGTDGWDNGIRKDHQLQQWQGCGMPLAGLILGKDGNFYGTTQYGGLDYGTIFRMTASGRLTYFFLFDHTSGCMPATELAQDADGNLYGTTQSGGTNGLGHGGFGTVFKITLAGKLVWAVCFAGANGRCPNTGLVQGPDGNFYGTTYGGPYATAYDGNASWRETFSCGTIYRVTTNGVLDTLVSFSNTNGACPAGKLVLAADGNFYGTTRYYNAAALGSDEVMGNGAIFKMTPSGKLSVEAIFDNLNGNTGPAGGLAEGTDGNLYGVTYNGGRTNLGSIFKITINRTTAKNQP